MEFRLIYGGSLIKAAGSGPGRRAWEKHQLRRHFHHQLKRLWETHPILRFYAQARHFQQGGFASTSVKHFTTIDSIAEHFEGYVPLVNEDFGMACELDVLFLRAEPAGHLLNHDSSGGDIDNRMKVLLDGLTMPQKGQVKLKYDDDPDPVPMFVLPKDDGLVTSLRITTDRLLTSHDDSDSSEACVVINVNVKTADPTRLPYELTL